LCRGLCYISDWHHVVVVVAVVVDKVERWVGILVAEVNVVVDAIVVVRIDLVLDVVYSVFLKKLQFWCFALCRNALSPIQILYFESLC